MIRKCPVCDEEKDNFLFTKRSHIIPDWMYEQVYTSDHKIYGLVSNSSGEKIKEEKLQSGYHANIICKSCEEKFSIDDTYIARVLKGGGIP